MLQKNSALIGANHIFLFSTHITTKKVIVGVAVLVVLVVAGVAYLVQRRRRSASSVSR